jgi:hypothetical protein
MTHGIRGYNPSGSGILSGSGELKHYHSRYPISLKDTHRIKEEVEDYEEGRDYSDDEMILLAEKILLMDPKPPTEDPMWLHGRMHWARKRREIYCAVGTPDPSVESGLYWRTHPNGRKVNSDTSRQEHGASYYKD